MGDEEEEVEEEEEEEEELKFVVRLFFRFMCVTNLVLWVIGIIIMVVGVWFNEVPSSYFQYTNLFPQNDCAMTFIISWTAFSLLGLIGYWGALKLDHDVICYYVCMILIAALLEMTCGSIAVSYDQMTDLFREETFLQELRNNYTDPYTDVYSKQLYDLQKQHGCCGAFDYRDWIESAWWKAQRNTSSVFVVPDSCCKDARTNRFCNTGVPPYTDVIDHLALYSEGCISATISKSYAFTISGLLATIIAELKLSGMSGICQHVS